MTLLSSLKVGFTEEGDVVALELTLFSNAGASVDLSYAVRLSVSIFLMG